MARRISNIIRLLIFAIGAPLLCSGQPNEGPTRSIEFWAYRVGTGNWSDIKFEARSEEIDTLSLGKFMKGRVHEYQGPASLVFFREEPDPLPNKPENKIRIPVAQTTIPSGIEEALLILTPAGGNSNREFFIHIVNADPTNFPINSIRVFNATGVRLAGRVGSDNKNFNPGISPPFSLEPFIDEGIPVAFLVETNEGPKFVYEKDLEYARDRRVILLLEPPRRKGSYKIQATNIIERVE